MRTTWLPLFPKDRADVLFFVGRGETVVTSPDVIELDCDDSYMGLPDKIRSIMRWADKQNYAHTLKLDDDVVVDPHAMLSSGFESFDYTGRANRMPTGTVPFWVPMGFAYWVSPRARKYLLDAPLPTEGNDDEKWTAQNLHAAGIHLHDDQRYKLQYGSIAQRPLRPVRQINRPLRSNPYTDSFPGTFAWCIFLEGNSGNTISTDVKIQEFHKVFLDQVISKKTN